MDAAEDSAPKKSSGDPSVVLFLGLYLILLAFFILLAAISTVEDTRSAAAVGSISSAFGDPGPDAPTGLSIIAQAGADPEDTGFRGEVEAAFHSSLPAEGFDSDYVGGVLRILVPASFIFGADQGSVDADRATLFEAIATALSYRSPGIRNDIELVVHTGKSLPALSGEEAAVAVSRAGALARLLRDNGVAARRISAGVRAGQAGTIAFFFQRRAENSPRVTFASAGQRKT